MALSFRQRQSWPEVRVSTQDQRDLLGDFLGCKKQSLAEVNIALDDAWPGVTHQARDRQSGKAHISGDACEGVPMYLTLSIVQSSRGRSLMASMNASRNPIAVMSPSSICLPYLTRATLAVAHADKKRPAVLDPILVITPPFCPEAAVQGFADTLAIFAATAADWISSLTSGGSPLSIKILRNVRQPQGRIHSDGDSESGHDDDGKIGAFARGASAATQAGLVVLPCGGEDGKAPLVKWSRMRAPLGALRLANWLGTPRIAGANLGIATGPSGLTVIDCDTPGALRRLIQRFGDTQIIVSTPRGGYHLYYTSSGERCGRIDEDDLHIDVKGIGGFVVAPPSLRPSGEHAGRPYFFILGSWDDIGALPAVNGGALAEAFYMGHSASSCELSNGKPGVGPVGVDVGRRNASLFARLLRIAQEGKSRNELLRQAAAINAKFAPPRWSAPRLSGQSRPSAGTGKVAVCFSVMRQHCRARRRSCSVARRSER